MRKLPLSAEVALYAWPVVLLFATIFAPGITAPCGSIIVPAIVPSVVPCAKTEIIDPGDIARRSAARKQASDILSILNLTFIIFLLGVGGGLRSNEPPERPGAPELLAGSFFNTRSNFRLELSTNGRASLKTISRRASLSLPPLNRPAHFDPSESDALFPRYLVLLHKLDVILCVSGFYRNFRATIRPNCAWRQVPTELPFKPGR